MLTSFRFLAARVTQSCFGVAKLVLSSSGLSGLFALSITAHLAYSKATIATVQLALRQALKIQLDVCAVL